MSATVTSALRRSPALAGPIACGCCLAAGAAYVAVVDPSEGRGVPCPFRMITGLWCPGCGLTRATHHLLRGNLGQAFRFNALVLVVLASIAIAWLAWLGVAAGRRFRVVEWVKRIPIWVQVAAGVVVLVFSVVRNLPGVDGLRG